MYYRPYIFTLSKRHSEYIDERIYADKKLPSEEREFTNGNRSEYIRKLINRDMEEMLGRKDK